jgi:transposase
MGPRTVFDHLRLEHVYILTSYSAVKRFCRSLARSQGPNPDDVAIVVDTPPGLIAQVDFGYVGMLRDPRCGQLRKAWCFVFVFGFSRHMLIRLVFDQTIETWIRVHIEAFEKFRGVPATLVPDNLKAAVIKASFGVERDAALNRTYRELAMHYGFVIDPAPPRAPKKKGKVEAGVKYVCRNCLADCEGQSIDEVQERANRWTEEIAGLRIHGTTGLQPLRVFQDIEQQALRPLPATRFEMVTWKQAHVRADGHVVFDRRFYSVPWPLLEQDTWVRATATTVEIHAHDVRVATHRRNSPGVYSTDPSHLPIERAELRHRDPAYWRERAGKMGHGVSQYIDEVFALDRVLSQLRLVQAMVLLLESYPVDRATAACLRAHTYGLWNHRSLKDILLRGLDREPLLLPASTVPCSPPKPTPIPRFARPVALWKASTQECDHEPERRAGGDAQEATPLRRASDA